MANAAAMIRESLWRDADFRRLTRTAQAMYMQLLSQRDLDCAGILTLNIDLLAKGCSEMTAEDVRRDLKTLEEERFVFVDEDTDEVLIRSYARLVSVRSPNAWKSCFKAARLISSTKLCTALAFELRRLRRKDADELANEIGPAHTPSESHSEPIRNPSEGDIPFESHSNPPRPVLVLGHLTSSTTRGGKNPPPICTKHDSNSDAPCHACRKRRLWEESHAAEADSEAAQERQRLRELSESCSQCHGTNVIDIGDDEVRKCDHGGVYA